MNANAVFSCADLSGEIFAFAFPSKPEKKCCNKWCNETENLKLFIKEEYRNYYSHPTLGVCQMLHHHSSTDIDIIEQYEAKMECNKERKWFCKDCWLKALENSNYAEHLRRVLFFQEENAEAKKMIKIPTNTNNELPKKTIKLTLDTNNELPNHIIDERRKELKTNATKSSKKIWKSIINGELIFKTHRINKTEEKAKYYEEWIYKEIKRSREYNKENAERLLWVNKNYIHERITKMKKDRCRDRSNEWQEEIMTRLITKYYHERKIHYKTFKYITEHCRTREWGYIIENYERSKHYRGLPNLPQFIYKL